MPNDARLGMVVGVGLVIAVAIFFVRKDVSPMRAPGAAQAVSTAPELSRVRPPQQVSGSPQRRADVKEKVPDESEGAAFTVSSPRPTVRPQEP